MKKYQYSVSTNTIWTSFDFGEVEADNYEDARTLAIEKLKADFRKANDALATIGLDVQFAEDQVEVTEI